MSDARIATSQPAPAARTEMSATPAGGTLSNATRSETTRTTPEGADGEEPRLGKLRAKLRAHRERIRANRTLNLTYRIGLGALGTVVLVAGILMIPYPGPGWLVVFAGLGILATEFNWAHSVNVFAKRHYHRWVEWLKRQHPITKLAVMSATGLIVLATLWLLGLFGTAASWVGLDWAWLRSPLFGP